MNHQNDDNLEAPHNYTPPPPFASRARRLEYHGPVDENLEKLARQRPAPEAGYDYFIPDGTPQPHRQRRRATSTPLQEQQDVPSATLPIVALLLSALTVGISLMAALGQSFSLANALGYLVLFGISGALVALGGALIARGLQHDQTLSIIVGLLTGAAGAGAAMLLWAAGIVSNINRIGR